MSLFERAGFEWRETFFVLFDVANRPSAEAIQETLTNLGDRMKIGELRADEAGNVEAVTVLAPDDFAGMDLVFITGDDVTEQLPELIRELEENAYSADEKQLVQDLGNCTARLDILHFEEHSFTADPDGAEADYMDPGGLLIVLQRMAELCQGTVVDPQTSSVM